MADDVLFQGDATGLDARVTMGFGVLVINTEEGRIIVSTPVERLRDLALKIHLELDCAESPRAGRR